MIRIKRVLRRPGERGPHMRPLPKILAGVAPALLVLAFVVAGAAVASAQFEDQTAVEGL